MNENPIESVPKLSEARLRKDWELVTGRSTTKTATPASNSGIQVFLELVRFRTWIGPSIAMFAIVAALSLVGIKWSRGTSVALLTPASWQSKGSNTLPRELLFQIAGSTVALISGDSQKFVLGSKTRSGNQGINLTIHDAYFVSSTATGESVRFSGRLILTNPPGVLEIRSKSHVIGASLVGELVIGNQAPIQIEQPFVAQ